MGVGEPPPAEQDVGLGVDWHGGEGGQDVGPPLVEVGVGAREAVVGGLEVEGDGDSLDGSGLAGEPGIPLGGERWCWRCWREQAGVGAGAGAGGGEGANVVVGKLALVALSSNVQGEGIVVHASQVVSAKAIRLFFSSRVKGRSSQGEVESRGGRESQLERGQNCVRIGRDLLCGALVWRHSNFELGRSFRS